MARRSLGVKFRVEGTEKLLNRLYQQERQLGEGKRHGGVSVIVGFSQNYAVPVHENTSAHHPVGMAKFLEKPARYLRRTMTQIIANGLRRGLSLVHSVLMAGLRLQREAQLLTPVDTGALRASAYTRKE